MNEENNNNEEKKEYQVLNQFKPKKRAVLATSLAPDSFEKKIPEDVVWICLLYTSPSPRDLSTSRMPSSA